MFGGVNAPANSPHLRKSGSRPVVYDLGNFIYKCPLTESVANFLSSSLCWFGVISIYHSTSSFVLCAQMNMRWKMASRRVYCIP